MLLRCPAIGDTISLDGVVIHPFQHSHLHGIEILVRPDGGGVFAAAFQVYQQSFSTILPEGIAMHAATFGGREFGHNARVRKGHTIVARLGILVFVREGMSGTVFRKRSTVQQGFVREGEEEDVLEIRTATTRLVRVAEAEESGMVVMIARGGEVCVGGQLHHTEGCHRHRHNATVGSGAHHGAHVGNRIKRLCAAGLDKRKDGEQRDENAYHGFRLD